MKPEAYIEPRRRYTMELFGRKYKQVFLQKSFIAGVRLGSEYASLNKLMF